MKFIIIVVMTCSFLASQSITDLDFTRINGHYYEKYMSSKECQQFPASCFFSLSSKEALEFLYEAAERNEAATYATGIYTILEPEIGKSITFSDLTSLLVNSNYNVEFLYAILELTLKFENQLGINPFDLISLLDEIASDPKNDRRFAAYAINKMGNIKTKVLNPELLAKYKNLALNANTFENIRIQSILFLETNNYPEINGILRTILRDENTTNPEVIGQAMLTLSLHSSSKEDIKLIDEIVNLTNSGVIFNKGISALGNIGNKDAIAKIMSHRNHHLARERNISFGLSRCSNMVISIAEEANTIEEKSYAIDCLEALSSPEAYYLLKGMRTNLNNPLEIQKKLEDSIVHFEIKYGKNINMKRKREKVND